MRQIVLILIVVTWILAKDHREVSGIITAGYGTIYNYEALGFNGWQVRINPLMIYKDFSFEIDAAIRKPENEFTPMVWSGVGYRLVQWEKMPDFWITGSWLYSADLKTARSSVSGEFNTPGVGFMLGMKGDWLPSCFTNFSMSYYPGERCFYKSMQIGWELKGVGLSVGGNGIRIKEGRLYSSFLFSLRYSFGTEWE